MRYIKTILSPSEKLLYVGSVHPVVLGKGLIYLALAAFILKQSVGTGSFKSIVLTLLYSISGYFAPFKWLYDWLLQLQQMKPDIAFDIKLLCAFLAMRGLQQFITQLIIMLTTELAITNRRVIAKTGVTTITTIEMDKRRIAGVIIEQSMTGRIMGYGYILIQGFTTSIGGLPVLVNPHKIERHLG
jgi:hypothetical protein